MGEITVLLDIESPSYQELESGFRANVEELENVHVAEKKEVAKPGTLAVGFEHAFAFVLQHKDIVSLATGVIGMVNNLLRFVSKKPTDEKARPIKIIVNGQTIAFPSSEATQKRFLQNIQNPSSSTAKAPSKKSKKNASKAKTRSRSKKR